MPPVGLGAFLMTQPDAEEAVSNALTLNQNAAQGQARTQRFEHYYRKF